MFTKTRMLAYAALFSLGTLISHAGSLSAPRSLAVAFRLYMASSSSVAKQLGMSPE